jgi:two-component system, NarL family, invasion response regulator UvrY
MGYDVGLLWPSLLVNAMRILVADDHAIVRQGLRQILSEAQDIQVVAEATNGHEVAEMIAAANPDVVVLDLTMPGKSGFDTLLDIKRQWPQLPVLILSVHPEDQYAVRTLKAGARGYLTKESAPEQLIAAVRKVGKGGKYVSASLAEELAAAVGAPKKPAPHERLSDKEYEVLCAITTGMSVKDIAQKLGLSVKTISTYRTRILEKMQMKNNAELICYVIDSGLSETFHRV